MSGYTAAETNGLLADYATIREELCRRLNIVDRAIDMDTAIRPTETGIRRRLARFIVEGHRLPVNPQTGQLPNPDVLKEAAIELRAQGRAAESHAMSRMARDVRLMIVIAGRMSRSMHPSPPRRRERARIRFGRARFSLAA